MRLSPIPNPYPNPTQPIDSLTIDHASPVLLRYPTPFLPRLPAQLSMPIPSRCLPSPTQPPQQPMEHIQHHHLAYFLFQANTKINRGEQREYWKDRGAVSCRCGAGNIDGLCRPVLVLSPAEVEQGGVCDADGSGRHY